MKPLTTDQRQVFKNFNAVVEPATTSAIDRIADYEQRSRSITVTATRDPEIEHFRSALLVQFGMIVRSAVTLFRIPDFYSAGMLTRKAMETMYCLVVVQKKGSEGLRLISLLGKRKFVSGMQDMMGKLNELDFAVDRSSIAKQVKATRESLPNQDSSILGAEKLADWAGYSDLYEKSYGVLNNYAHFNAQQLHALVHDDIVSLSGTVKHRAVATLELFRALLLALRDGLPDQAEHRDQLIAIVGPDFQTYQALLLNQMNNVGAALGSVVGFVRKQETTR